MSVYGSSKSIDGGDWSQEGVEADIDCAFAKQREADCRLKAGEQNDAMNAYHNAAKSYKKSDPEGVSLPSNAYHSPVVLF